MEGKTKLLGILAGLMGGRSAEEIVFGDITSGASADLKEATRLARLMVCSWGMSDALGPQTFGEHEELMFLGREISRSQDYSEETAQCIDREVNQMLRRSHDRALEILTSKRAWLDMIAALLLERETLDGRDVEEIVAHGRILSEAERDQADKARKEEESAAGRDEPAGRAAAQATDQNAAAGELSLSAEKP